MREHSFVDFSTSGGARDDIVARGEGMPRGHQGGQRAASSLYALLGIAEFEADSGVIRRAIEDRMARAADAGDPIPNRPNGDGGAASTAVGSAAAAQPNWRDRAIQRAREILMDPEKKREYDADLRRQSRARRAAREPIGHEDESVGAIGDGSEIVATEPSGLVAAAGLVRCAECKATNPATARFCGICGSSLWQKCFQCGQTAPLGARYCGQCGADLLTELEQQIARLRDAIRQAETLVEEYQFDQAIDLLGPVSRLDHPRLRPWVDQATKLLRGIAARREEARKFVTEKCEEASRFRAADEYDAALAVLESIPESLRTDTVRADLADLRVRAAEVITLSAEVQAALRGEKVPGLLDKVGRLLTLQPGHAEARRAVERLERRLLAQARELIHRHEYDAAVALLDRIPGSARSADVAKLYEYAAELAWLDFEVSHEPVFDDRMVEICRRFARLAPRHPRLPEVLKKLERKQAEYAPGGPAEATGPRIWTRPVTSSYLGVPVLWVDRLVGFDCAEDLDPSIHQAPGRFLGALGLALQGLGGAVAPINLLRAEGRGLRGVVNALMRARHARSALGIDVGTSAVKAVRLEIDGDASIPRIAWARLAAYRKPLSQAVNPAEEDQLVAEAIAAITQAGGLKADRTCVAAGSRWLLTHRIDLPPLSADRLAKLIDFEVRSQLPVPIEQLDWDYCLPGHHESTRGDADGKPAARQNIVSQPVFVAAMRRIHARRALAPLEQARLSVDVLQSDALAALEALVHSAAATEKSSPEAPPTPARSSGAHPTLRNTIALVDIGADSASLLIAGPRCLVLRQLGTTGQSFTRALVQQENLRLDQAESLKREITKARSIARLQACFNPVLEQLATAIRNGLASHAENDPEQPVERLYLIGGGALLHGLVRFLSHGR